MNFFDILYAKNHGEALSISYFDALFAKYISPVIEWAEYDGTLPATYTANGDYLADYRIYGAAGGVGDRTENLFDGEMESGYYDNNGEKQSSPNWIRCKNLISVQPNTTYHAIIDNPGEMSGSVVFARCYDARGEYIGTTNQTVIQYYKEYAFTTFDNTAFISFYVSVSYNDAKFAIYQTTISGKPYIPYGYEVDMSVSDGTTSTTTQIYIGDTPLEEDEYVDYGEGKVHRRTENLFDKNAKDTNNGFVDNRRITSSGATIASNTEYISEYIPVVGGEAYTAVGVQNSSNRFLEFLDENKDYIAVEPYAPSGDTTFTTPQNAAFIRITVLKTRESNVEVVFGSTGPSTYIPYLQPTDPPVPLPALPTVDGTTITDYAGQSAAVPSRFYAKYRKG